MMVNRKKRPGRPRKPGCRQISFWGSDAEATQYNKAAKKAKMSRSKWLRKVANEAAGVE
jgi:hypothetical protein